jgi:cystathionine beta-lyase family protein involved in aluminum resistance
MTAAGVGREVGASLGHNRELYMGIFNAPHVTGEAMKSAVYAAALFSQMGYEVSPTVNEERGDIIQSIKLGDPKQLIAFCKGMQSAAPVDSHLTPEPWDMPGYDDQVIMAAGAFTGGSSIELSADAPLREPFAVWMQGGINFHSARAGILMAANEVLKVK